MTPPAARPPALAGRVALVTGGSRGIGAAVAERLAAEGADVAVAYATRPGAAEAVAARVRDLGRRAVTLGGDLADPAVAASLVRGTEEGLGPVDVLVANAGVGERADLEAIGVEDWDRTLAVNLRAPFLLAQAAAPGMARRGFGRIVLMSSVAAYTGGVLAPHYAASKAGLIGLAHALAARLAGDGVTVNALAPALVATDMVADNPAIADHLGDRIPVGRLGRAAEVADIVAAVVANAYVTGQTVSVDGGLHPR